MTKFHGVKSGSRFFGSFETISWVTVGHGKLRVATNGGMDIAKAAAELNKVVQLTDVCDDPDDGYMPCGIGINDDDLDDFIDDVIEFAKDECGGTVFGEFLDLGPDDSVMKASHNRRDRMLAAAIKILREETRALNKASDIFEFRSGAGRGARLARGDPCSNHGAEPFCIERDASFNAHLKKRKIMKAFLYCASKDFQNVHFAILLPAPFLSDKYRIASSPVAAKAFMA